MRLSQTVSPFGVGSIMDILGESLMGMDISTWPYQATTRVESRRLELALGVSELRSPPSVPSYASVNTSGIYYQRFPKWLFCQDCRRMHEMRMLDETGEPPVCAHCRGRMVPMRFIVVGTVHGHAMDVPWVRWAHSEPEGADQERCQARDLLFETRRGGTEGLGSLLIRCAVCDANRDLGSLTSKDALRRIGVRCNGTQPWLPAQSGDCDERLEVLQRGATNVTISEVTTALDIPDPALPLRDIEAEIRQHRNFSNVSSAPTGPRADMLIELIAEELGVAEEVVRRVAQDGSSSDDSVRRAKAGLLADEWDAFRQAIERPGEMTGTHNFVVSTAPLVDAEVRQASVGLEALFSSVVLVHRLREVRVLHGFRRYDVAADMVNVNLGRGTGIRWLPAVEAFGEGVMLVLDDASLAEWESKPEVQARAQRLEQRRRDTVFGSRFGETSPRQILMHTLSHLMMRQLAFSSGYSAASLRERVYASTAPRSESGILIYTAAGDSEGTLGGLVRLGEPPRLAQTVLQALESAAWCSADPVCRESRGQGLGSLNLAACHGCCLVAETSCERSNVLLDRVLVIGDSTTPGFFSDVIETLFQQAAARSSSSV